MNDPDGALAALMEELRSREDPAARAGMARYGIGTGTALGGTSIPVLRAMAKRAGKDHALAGALWATGVHEARLLATMVDDPKQVTEAQMEAWAGDFHSWDICDQCCSNLFAATPFAWPKAEEWACREEEFVKRAGFALMAVLAVHDKKAGNERFIALLPLIEEASDDDRNFVRKAVNWALRQIGKRNLELNRAAIERGESIGGRGGRAAKWIAADALRELRSEAVQARLRSKQGKTKAGLPH